MFAFLKSSLGWKEDEALSPPPATIVGIRIPADGSPVHLLHLTTAPDSGGTTTFLHHVPDTRWWWQPKETWQFRDAHRIDLQLDENTARTLHIQQKERIDQVCQLRLPSTRRGQLEVR
ncbi:hypothetical protein CC86DRAFT_39246 [Ophiobolus disseminans]|uniref:Uncharacterized protein n=1 Tax=Ophiobolus disseminans TaxID=1469910 RepID=A0A6A6ZX39_9PLEO|nr:hypothetical protein CC86DRAFT_39246 [Ophiobolus disseminans]